MTKRPEQMTHATGENMKKDIYVTQPFLPPLEEFLPYLEEIWRSKILTNCGPFHHQFEDALDLERGCLDRSGWTGQKTLVLA